MENLGNGSGQQLKQKVTLERKGESHVVKLAKKDSSEGIVINLAWQTRADLDLGCFYELRPAQTGGLLSRLAGNLAGNDKNVIDGLQFANSGGPRDRVTRQGCYTQRPYIWHAGDDRSGAEMQEGESIWINPEGIEEIRRMTVYAFIYEGVARWQQTDAVVTVRVPGNPDVAVEMGRQSSRKTFAAIAGLDFEPDGRIKVTKHLTFHNGHADCDRKYRWGMRWQAGSK